MSISGWHGVDLDGTLARYEGWRGIEHIGEPVPAMLAQVKAWLAAGEAVKIVTARVCNDPDGSITRIIEGWCEEHVGQVLPVVCSKDFGMFDLAHHRSGGRALILGNLLAPKNEPVIPNLVLDVIHLFMNPLKVADDIAFRRINSVERGRLLFVSVFAPNVHCAEREFDTAKSASAALVHEYFPSILKSDFKREPALLCRVPKVRPVLAAYLAMAFPVFMSGGHKAQATAMGPTASLTQAAAGDLDFVPAGTPHDPYSALAFGSQVRRRDDGKVAELLARQILACVYRHQPALVRHPVSPEDFAVFGIRYTTPAKSYPERAGCSVLTGGSQ